MITFDNMQCAMITMMLGMGIEVCSVIRCMASGRVGCRVFDSFILRAPSPSSCRQEEVQSPRSSQNLVHEIKNNNIIAINNIPGTQH